jgi:hypothetical protein
MTKWYNRQIEVVTKRNFISVFLFIFSIFFYFVQKISDSDTAGIIAIFSFSISIGQSIGERIGEKRKNDPIMFYLLAITIIICIFQKVITYGETVSMFAAGILVGERIGFEIGRMRAKKQID